MTDGPEWDRPPPPQASAGDRSEESRDPNLIGKARGPVELAGLLLVIGAATLEVGQSIIANDFPFDDSLGDFFQYLAIYQLLVLPMATLGVILCIAPRLFLRSRAGLPSGVATSGVVVGLIVVLVAVVYSFGGLVVAFARASDDEIGQGTGGWISQIGVLVMALAALVLVCSAVAFLRSPASKV